MKIIVALTLFFSFASATLKGILINKTTNHLMDHNTNRHRSSGVPSHLDQICQFWLDQATSNRAKLAAYEKCAKLVQSPKLQKPQASFRRNIYRRRMLQ
ncbi:Oidioi.mRNA.OKI2018_I69.chr1.g3634.t1.cds [Oikopleura dioica]|uniref:Oidioi.mRNA.OKI2018_I69.chr1.g3634.t1.cds n=1 Tax=Oikopleura dioica TaxID=34765 RepID=A0ABN7SZ20_OIKDI|nr:Oidioi.mRNA.OKI2018_I69.chr1.g3634.t1.cds [Oikopleura dioica]